jgi:hypothetical protein
MYIKTYIKHKMCLNRSENDYRRIWFACFVPVVMNLDFHKVISDQKKTGQPGVMKIRRQLQFN